MKNTISIAGVACCIAISAVAPVAAQPSYYENQRNQARESAENREHLRMVYENNRPRESATYNKPSAPAPTPEQREAARKALEESDKWREKINKEYWERLAREKATDARNAELVKQQKAAAVQAAVAEDALWVKKRDEYFARSAADYGRSLPEEDRKDLERDIVYAWRNRIKYEEDSFRLTAIAAFKEKRRTGSYEELMQIAAATAPHARFTTAVYGATLTRFPENRAEIERAALAAMPYYFGSRRPVLNVDKPDFMAACIYDEYSVEAKDKLLDAFDGLATAYPAEALVAAGACRNGLNPFLLLAQRSERKEAQCADYHWKVLRSDYRKATPKWYKEPNAVTLGSLKTTAKARLYPSARYLLTHQRDVLEDMSAEDWHTLGELHSFSMRLMLYAFVPPTADAAPDAMLKDCSWEPSDRHTLPRLWKLAKAEEDALPRPQKEKKKSRTW